MRILHSPRLRHPVGSPEGDPDTPMGIPESEIYNGLEQDLLENLYETIEGVFSSGFP